MNINCFQYNKVKNCRAYMLEGYMLIGIKKYTGHEVYIPITRKQKEQGEDSLLFKGIELKIEKR